MEGAKENLTHEEIWDDSALVNSWNEALEEYKKYHSIHSKGGNVDSVLIAHKTSDDSDAKDDGALQDPPSTEGGGKAELDGMEQGGNPETRQSQHTAEKPAFIPAPLLGSVRDEGLKKLLMSWYYAGYYTGYYEGQQAQQQ